MRTLLKPIASIKTPYDPAAHQRLTFHDAVAHFLDGRDSPAAYLDRCMATIRAREPVVQAWQAMRIDAACAEAERASRRYRAGKPLSPIDGMPVGIKDLIQTFDLPTSEGIAGNDEARSAMDSACVQALRAAGAVIVGKLVTTELGGGHPGKTTNPFDPARTPGGSSSGSGAAIGAAMLPVAIGTQVGGSVIRPAGYCANFAIKPTFGALHRGERQSSSQSCVGVHAGSLQDLWAVTHEIAQRTGGDPGHPGLFGPAAPAPASRPQRVMVMECTGWRVTDEKTRRAFGDVCDQLCAQGVVVLRRGDHRDMEAFEESLAQTGFITGVILAYENRWYVENLARRGAQLAPSTLASLDRSRSLTVDDYRQALALRRTAQERFAGLATHVDALISPATPGPAPLMGTPPAAAQPVYVATGDPVYNLPVSMLLAPAMALPLMAVEGMPVGLQLIGQPHDDYRITGHARWMMDNIRPVSVP